MTARHLMQIAALASALCLTGTAVAVSTDGTSSGSDRAATSSSGMDTPSSGAIVTPEDKAMGLGRDHERAGDRDRDVNDDRSTLNDNRSNDDHSTFNPWPSKDELTVDPRRADVEHASPGYGRPTSPGAMDRNGRSTLDEDKSAPARAGSDVESGDMGPGNVRGQ